MSSYDKAKKIFLDFLQEKQLRKTPERFAILEEIYENSGHFDVESLYISMKNKNYRVSRATVYNTLDLLVECDLVTKHQFGKNLALYEKSFEYRQHDHAICTLTNEIFEFCDPRVEQIKQLVEDTFDFTVTRHSLNFYGYKNSAMSDEQRQKEQERKARKDKLIIDN